jgi:hypothetical protein
MLSTDNLANWRVYVVVTWLYAVYSDWVISNLCSGNTPNYTLSGFAPFKNGYSEYPFLTLTLYHIETHTLRILTADYPTLSDLTLFPLAF